MTQNEFIDALKERGILNEEAQITLKRDVLVSKRTAEDLIFDHRLADSKKVAEAKSEILGIPFQKVDLDRLTPELLELIPEETVRTYGVAPLESKDGLLIAGMLYPENEKAQEALTFLARRNRLNLGVYIISYEDWLSILRKYSPYKNEVESIVKSLNLKNGAEAEKLVGLEENQGGNEDAPIIKLVAKTLREAVEIGASDVHFEPQEQSLRIRFRVNGDLQEAASLPSQLSQPVVSRVKVMSNLRIDETRIPQDGRFRTKISDREIDFRVSTFPTPRGEKVAVRVLDPTTGLKKLDDLGLRGKNKEIIESGIKKPFGLVLISGPTGSGKSTTLYALLQLLNKESVNIVSLEDPVEYFVSGVNQSQVRPEIGYDFASGLRQILRQDPDIIMVGEIRDNETAALAIHAALTGHIVLSTLHTNNAVGIIPRLIDMKVEPFLLPSALNLLLSQRLVSKICEKCKKPEEASEPMQKAIKKTLADLPSSVISKYKEPYVIYRGAGCQVCKGRGVNGRIAIYEAFEMTPELEGIVNSDPTPQKILAEAKKQNMLTMREDGVLKALDGIVLLEDVIRETEE